jgi:hypothetical protein
MIAANEQIEDHNHKPFKGRLPKKQGHNSSQINVIRAIMMMASWLENSPMAQMGEGGQRRMIPGGGVGQNEGINRELSTVKF